MASQEMGQDQLASELDVEACYRKYGPMVLRRCRRFLKEEDKAVDAMHDVFVQLLRYKSRMASTQPAALLQRIATNVCLNRIRSIKRKPENTEEELLVNIASTEDSESNLSAKSILGRIFGGEKESTRTIAVLHLVDGMTLEEVAREVGLSVSGVRKRLRTLRGRVAQLEGV